MRGVPSADLWATPRGTNPARVRPDEDFVLDRVGRVVVAAGFSGHGFKFGPAIGRVLADLAGEESDGPAGGAGPRFTLGRFAG